MEALDETFQAATRGPNRFTAGAVLTTANRDTTWTKSFGGVSAQDGAADMKDDTLMWVASCTKLMTTVAAMQCVEKGLFTLDENISRVLPEWKSPDILTGFDDKTGEPLLRKATKAITLRHLLTHSSGMGYDMFNPLLLALRKYQGREPGTLTGNIVSFCSNHQVGSTLAD
jgi:CubicO group peptidase (beta-lactamase class C family)